MYTKKDKLFDFLRKTGKSYSCKSSAKVLKMKHETTRKYLRELYNEGFIARIRSGKSHRYFV